MSRKNLKSNEGSIEKNHFLDMVVAKPHCIKKCTIKPYTCFRVVIIQNLTSVYKQYHYTTGLKEQIQFSRSNKDVISRTHVPKFHACRKGTTYDKKSMVQRQTTSIIDDGLIFCSTMLWGILDVKYIFVTYDHHQT